MATSNEGLETAYEAMGLIDKAKRAKRNKILFVLMLIVGIIVLIVGAVWLVDEFEIESASTGGWVGAVVTAVIGLVLIIGGSLIQGLGKKNREKTDNKELGEKLYTKLEEETEKQFQHIYSKKIRDKDKAKVLDENFTNFGRVIVLSKHAVRVSVLTHDVTNFCFSFAIVFDNGATVTTYLMDNKDGNSAYFAYLHYLYRALSGSVIPGVSI